MNNWSDFSCYVSEKLENLQISETGTAYDIKHFVGKHAGAKIEIYSKEHPPPHFHVQYNDFNCSYEISTEKKLIKIKGAMDRKVEKKLKYLYKSDPRFSKNLIKTWNDTRPENCPVGKIGK